MAFLFIFSAGIHAQQMEIKDVVTDPAISRRCRSLIEERNEKIRVQQRLNSLLQRNLKLIKKVKPQQLTIKNQLEYSQTRIQNNLSLAKLRIKAMEEDIVRKGCPGINL